MNDFKKLSDFEKNLFLKKQIEYLKGLLSRAGVTKALALKDIEIGKLKSERDEMEYNYEQAVKNIDALKKNLEKLTRGKEVKKKIKIKTVKAYGPELENIKLLNQQKSLYEMQIAIKKLKDELSFYKRESNTFPVTTIEKQDQLLKKYPPEIIPMVLEDLIESEEALSFNCSYYKTIKKHFECTPSATT